MASSSLISDLDTLELTPLQSFKLAKRQNRKLMTSIEELVSMLGNFDVDGPEHYREPNLDARGSLVGKGAQFEVFEDSFGVMESTVMKRVQPAFLKSGSASLPDDKTLRSYYRTLELEIRSLCDERRRKHPNIVRLVGWGYDYPTSNMVQRLPVLKMEKAFNTLSAFLQPDSRVYNTAITSAIKHHICLDIAEGLACIHDSGLAHGDIKPANVLIFQQNDERVPWTAKLSDFGLCINIDDEIHGYEQYKGTPGWQPPEVADGSFSSRQSFYPDLLVKSDSYVYGLLVLSVFTSKAQCLKRNYTWSPEEFLPCLDEEDSCIDSRLIWTLKRFVRQVLPLEPGDRVTVSSQLLDSGTESFLDWSARHIQKNAIVAPNNSKHPARQDALNHGYWRNLDVDVLYQLEERYDALRISGHETMDPNTLLGMAIGFTQLPSRESREKIWKFVEAAAKPNGGSTAAQGMIGRLAEAFDKTEYVRQHREDLHRWLYNAAADGSLHALTRLREISSSEAESARMAFKERGGYNEPVDELARQGFELMKKRCQSPSHSQAYFSGPCDANAEVDLNGNHLLHIAALKGDVEAVRSLIANHANINTRNTLGETPLYRACVAGSCEVVKALTDFGADASVTTEDFSISCLHWLFNFDVNELDIITDRLLKCGADLHAQIAPISRGFERRQISWRHFPFCWPSGTPLHWASEGGCFEAVNVLLGRGADIDEVGGVEEQCFSVLFKAAYRGDAGMVERLLARGADATKISAKGLTTAHMMGVEYQSTSSLWYLSGPFRWWINHGKAESHVEQVRRCIQALKIYGLDLNMPTRQIGNSSWRNTPLIDAANNFNSGVMLALIENGITVNQTETASGKNLLHILADQDSHRQPYPALFTRLWTALCQHVHDLNTTDMYGRTALHFATHMPNEEDFQRLSQLLVTNARFTGLDAGDEVGNTPLLLATRLKPLSSGESDAVRRCQYLLRLGADPLVRNDDGCDMIWMTCANAHLSNRDCMALILQSLHGVPRHAQTDRIRQSVNGHDGTTALMMAALGSYESAVEYFLHLGININALCHGNGTALDRALQAAQDLRQHLRFWLFEGKLTIKEKLVPSVSEDRLFSKTYTRSDQGSRVANGFDPIWMLRRKYFASTSIIQKLVNAGAKRGKDLVSDAYELTSPRRWDANLVDEFEGEVDGFTPEKQPYWEHWKVIYDLIDD